MGNGSDSRQRREKNKISRFSMAPESGLSRAMILVSNSSLSYSAEGRQISIQNTPAES
jgi:hypothetical protein